MPTPKRITLYGGPAHGCQVPPWLGDALHVRCEIKHTLREHTIEVTPYRFPPSLTAIYFADRAPKGRKRPVSAIFSHTIYHRGIHS